jgi:hypothetical protein
MTAAAVALIGAAPGWAASMTITTDVPTFGTGPQTIHVMGHSDRPGSYDLRVHTNGEPCQANIDLERGLNGGYVYGPSLGGRQNLSPSEDFNETYTFNFAGGSTGTRFCGYLGDYNENQSAPPDALGQLLVCSTGYTLQANACVAGSGGGSGTCAKNGKYDAISVLNVDCAQAQTIEASWGKSKSCKVSKRRKSSTCTVQGFTCKAKRRRPKGAQVRCSAAPQIVRFKFTG